MVSRRTGAESLRPSLARLAAALDGVSPASIAKADKRAVVTVRRRFEPAAKRLVRETYNVRAGDLAGKFTVSTSELSGAGAVLRLNASTYKIPLAAFGGRWTGRNSPGATAAIGKGAGRKVYHHAFIATLNGQQWMVVRQFSSASHLKSGRDPRNKLKRLAGPSPFQMVRGQGDENAKRLSREMNELRSAEIIRQLKLARKGVL